MFVLMLLVFKGFLPPPLVCSAPGAESNSAGWAENVFAPFGRDSAPPKKFSAPAKINPAHATAAEGQKNRNTENRLKRIFNDIIFLINIFILNVQYLIQYYKDKQIFNLTIGYRKMNNYRTT